MKVINKQSMAKMKGHKTADHQVNSDTSSDTLLHMACGTTGFLLFVTILSGIVLASSTTYADDAGTDTVNLTVEIACTLATGGGSYSTSVNPGNYTRINGNAISTVCNDPNGYSLYAIGYSGDSYDTPTNTQMIGTGSIGNIATGTATTGNTSGWAMQVTPTTGSAPTITNGFDSTSFHVVPAEYTQVAKYTSTTASPSATGASVDVKYQIYAATAQAAGTYTGKVKYTMVHPNTAPAPKIQPTPPTTCNTPVPNVTYMQDITPATKASVLASLTTGNAYYLRDNRDEEPYCVSKLADGNLWMLDNLRLGGTSTMALTPADTNIASNFTLPASTTTGFNYDNLTCYTTAAVNADYKNTTTTSYGAGSGKIGNYYNYCAASAGTYCYADGSGTGNATHDICPAGWRMPTGGSSGEYLTLCSAYDSDCQSGYSEIPATSTSSLQYNLSTPLSGNFHDGSVNIQGGGRFWSSTRYDGHSMHYLQVVADWAGPLYYNSYRYVGESVRCLLGS